SAAKADNTIDHVFVWVHQAPYSVGQHGDDVGSFGGTGTQQNFTPIFDDAASKVTAVFAGHDHIYARMDDGSHPVYVVSGGAGAPGGTGGSGGGGGDGTGGTGGTGGGGSGGGSGTGGNGNNGGMGGCSVAGASSVGAPLLFTLALLGLGLRRRRRA